LFGSGSWEMHAQPRTDTKVSTNTMVQSIELRAAAVIALVPFYPITAGRLP
jgi:hypothetical protein